MTTDVNHRPVVSFSLVCLPVRPPTFPIRSQKEKSLSNEIFSICGWPWTTVALADCHYVFPPLYLFGWLSVILTGWRAPKPPTPGQPNPSRDTILPTSQAIFRFIPWPPRQHCGPRGGDPVSGIDGVRVHGNSRFQAPVQDIVSQVSHGGFALASGKPTCTHMLFSFFFPNRDCTWRWRVCV